MALLRTFGFLLAEVPGDVVVVHRHGLDGLVAAATANRYRREHDVFQRVRDQRYHRDLIVAAHHDFDTREVVTFTTCFVEFRRRLIEILGDGEVLVIWFARSPFSVAYVAGDLHRHTMTKRQEFDLLSELVHRAGSLNCRIHFHQKYVHDVLR